MNEDFIYSYRIISLLKSILGKLIHYICDFYINRLNSEQINLEQIKSELRFDTCVPRMGFVNKEEYEIYKKRFLEFENEIIKELLQRRKDLGIDKKPEIEYIITNLFIPIKKVMEKL